MLASGSRLLLPLLATAVLAQQPEWHGVPFTLPAGWTTRTADEVLLVVPPGEPGAAGVYGFLFDAETKALDAADLADAIAAAAEDMLPDAAAVGTPAAATFGALAGKLFTFRGTAAGSERVDLRFHVFAAKGGVAAFFVLGRPDALKTQAAAAQALLDSFGKAAEKPKRRAFGKGGAADGADGKPGDAERKPAEGAGAVRIEGGKEHAWNGVVLDLPKGWRTQAGDGGAVLLVPPDANQAGVLEELYALIGDGSVKAIDAPDAVARLQQELDQIQPGLAPDGEPKTLRFGALPGRLYRFAGDAGDGRRIAARVHAFPAGNGAGALLALGFATALDARGKAVDQVLGSLRPAAKGAGGTPAELAGQWVYFSSVSLNDGGRASGATLTLRADGTYLYTAETSSSNPLGGAVTNERDSGRWSLEGQTMTFRSDGGTVATYAFEKRNHPKNKDPMIVLDGKTFVTATQRAPW